MSASGKETAQNAIAKRPDRPRCGHPSRLPAGHLREGPVAVRQTDVPALSRDAGVGRAVRGPGSGPGHREIRRPSFDSPTKPDS